VAVNNSGPRRRCIVAGASGGIGRAIADAMACDGWDVHGIGRKRPVDWPAADRTFIEFDLLDTLDDEDALGAALRQAGALPGATDGPEVAVVHAVGDIYDGVIGAGPGWPRWRRTMDLCLGTAVTLVRATFDAVSATAGSYLFVSSVAAGRPYPGIPDYCASKAALNAYMVSLARELAPYMARANCVSPAVVRTPLFDKSPYMVEEASTWHALGRIGEPAEIAALVAFLAGPSATWITGEDYVVDGGMGL
jgi:3-oxoacyl-[acyl-carrier protein] reductase